MIVAVILDTSEVKGGNAFPVFINSGKNLVYDFRVSVWWYILWDDITYYCNVVTSFPYLMTRRELCMKWNVCPDIYFLLESCKTLSWYVYKHVHVYKYHFKEEAKNILIKSCFREVVGILYMFNWSDVDKNTSNSKICNLIFLNISFI